MNEVSILIRKVKEDTDLITLMRLHKRSKESIKNKLNNLAAEFYFTNSHLFKQIQTLTGVTEHEFLVKRGLVGESKSNSEVSSLDSCETTPLQSPSISDSEQIHICTEVALKILNTIIDSSLILKKTIEVSQ